MEEEKEGDIWVPLVSSVFCLCVTTGGVFLVLYVFYPHYSQHWYPIIAFALIGFPWLFWFLVYIYACIKRCCYRNRDAPQISHPRDNSGTNCSQSGEYDNSGGKSQQGGRGSSATSSKESEMPLTESV